MTNKDREINVNDKNPKFSITSMCKQNVAYHSDFFNIDIKSVSEYTTHKRLVWSVEGNKQKDEPWMFYVYKFLHEDIEGKKWGWQIDDQCFYDNDFATLWLIKFICEYNTGVRVLDHQKGKIPVVCEPAIRNCAHLNECNSSLCQGCPISESYLAIRDGFELKYKDSSRRQNSSPIKVGDTVKFNEKWNTYSKNYEISQIERVNEGGVFIVAYTTLAKDDEEYAVLAGVLIPVNTKALTKTNRLDVKSLMLWKDDFEDEERWQSVLDVLDIPNDTKIIELGAIVRTHK